MKDNRSIGKLGEDAVYEYLIKKGYVILYRNFRCKAGEVDIIAKDGNVFVFIEVKSRKSLTFGYPAESVTKEKMMRIRKAAEYFILKYDLFDQIFRFDVVEVFITQKNTIGKINLIKNAF